MNRAFLGAYRKGLKVGRKRNSTKKDCPYDEFTTGNSGNVTFL